jgi:hypothetical protein
VHGDLRPRQCAPPTSLPSPRLFSRPVVSLPKSMENCVLDDDRHSTDLVSRSLPRICSTGGIFLLSSATGSLLSFTSPLACARSRRRGGLLPDEHPPAGHLPRRLGDPTPPPHPTITTRHRFPVKMHSVEWLSSSAVPHGSAHSCSKALHTDLNGMLTCMLCGSASPLCA